VKNSISVVIPVYGCKTVLVELYIRLKSVLGKISDEFEIIFVNDCGPDKAWDAIIDMAKLDDRVKGIDFSRNFGQHNAIFAGLEHCSCEWIVVMDCDLQDRPEEITNLYNKAMEGFDAVLARRVQRQDTFSKKLFSLIFYKLFGYLTNTKYDNTVANFGIYSRPVIEAVLSMKDKVRVFPVLLQWVGFNKYHLDVVHNERVQGKSSYSYSKLIKLAIDIVISFSNKPLILTIRFGLMISFLSLIIGILYAYLYFSGQIPVPGYASIVISIWFLSGLIIFAIGILGIYIDKLFDAAKDRPNYIIKNKLNI
jgi:dolichol-phosphate mannosyltransferase